VVPKVGLISLREEARMTDPSIGMKSFQQALRRGGIVIHVAKTDPNLFVHLDAPNGPPEIRYTYVRLKGKTVTALVIFAAEPPIKGKPHFSIGYAVPKTFQNQGRAKEILAAGIADMRAGLSRNGFPEFYLDAIVGADNVASRRIAEQLISDKPKAITERHSGLPAFKYVRKIA
jgi:RimJ/RimL family protein N-acetyltransferase